MPVSHLQISYNLMWNSLKRSFLASSYLSSFTHDVIWPSDFFYSHSGCRSQLKTLHYFYFSSIIMKRQLLYEQQKFVPEEDLLNTSCLCASQDLQENKAEQSESPFIQNKVIAEGEMMEISSLLTPYEPQQNKIENVDGTLPSSLQSELNPEEKFLNAPPSQSSFAFPEENKSEKAENKLSPSLHCMSIPDKVIINVSNELTMKEPHDDITQKSERQLPPSLERKLISEGESTNGSSHDLHLQECHVENTKTQLSPSLIKFIENFVKYNIDHVTDQIIKEGVNEGHEREMSPQNAEQLEKEAEEMPFSNMELFSSESAESSVNVKRKKSAKKKKKKSSKKKDKKINKDGERNNLQSENDGEPHERPKRKFPNYFVAIQVNNKQIVNSAKTIQAGIQKASGKDLSSLEIAPETLHITLMVMHLGNQEEIDKASKCLEKSVPAIKDRQGDQTMSIDFEKLSGFSGGRVIYACVKSPGMEILQVMSDEVKQQMKECDVENADPENKPFRPHLTLMKYRWKKSQKAKYPQKIESSWYEDFLDEHLGSQTIASLQLCRMQEKREDGYYIVEHEVPFKSEL